MKQLLSILILTVLLSFSTNEEKKITLVWTVNETNYVLSALSNSRMAILESNLPMKTGREIIALIDSAQKLIVKQAEPQTRK